MNHTLPPDELPDLKHSLPELPRQRESVAQQVERLTRRYLEEWQGCDKDLPAKPRTYSPREQAQNERQAGRMLDGLQAELKRAATAAAHADADRQDADAARQRIMDGMFDFARGQLDVRQEDLEMVRSAGFLKLAEDFVSEARRFDPQMHSADIFQASRNVLSMGYMQFLLDLPVRLTPSIFAYSMLYPYSDNLLDDPSISLEERKAFNLRFRQRLEGTQAALDPGGLEGSRTLAPNCKCGGTSRPSTRGLEVRIWELTAMVETEYPRDSFPQVYESLLAIHSAQGKSMLQRRPGAGPYELDVMGISIEKGGASTLADGYLVAGALSAEQAAGCFGYGAFTQLMDDLEDVDEDRKAGFQTIFSQLAGHWKLDGLTRRAMRFAGGIIRRMEAFPNREARRLAVNMDLAVQMLFAFSAGSHPAYYSRSFLEELERRLPVRFAFVKKQSRRMERRGLGAVELMMAMAGF
jgi:hypothetical protein